MESKNSLKKNYLEKNLLNLEEGSGYNCSLKLSQEDLAFINLSIRDQWLSRIEEINKRISSKIKRENIDISNYHKISQFLDHPKAWNKKSRTLPKKFSDWFENSEIYNNLQDLFGYFTISDEEKFGWPNIYWRLVRPNNKNDIGPLHRDSWFWELNDSYPKYEIPFKRVKVWIAICSEIGLNGLLLEPHSQKREDILYSGEFRDGIRKPILLNSLDKIETKLIQTKPGDVIIFDDNLLHGGALNKGKNTRVSIEFTMIVNR